MQTNPAEKIIARVRRFRFLFLILQLGVVPLFLWLTALLIDQIRQKYFLYYPFASFLIAVSISALLVMRALLRFRKATVSHALEKLDEKYALLDRLSTYNELRNSDHPFLAPFVKEIGSKIEPVSPFFPLARISGLTTHAVSLVLLLVLILAFPYLPETQKISSVRKERQEISVQARKLEKQILRLQKTNRTEFSELLKDFEKTVREMQNPDQDKENALKNLNKMQDDLQALEKDVGATNKQKFVVAVNQVAVSAGTEAEKEAMRELLNQFQNQDADQDSLNRTKKALKDERLLTQVQKKLQKAINDYKVQESNNGRQLAEMRKALEDAKKGISQGTKQWTSDSGLTEKDLKGKKGGIDDGPGTTNQDIGPNHFDTKKNGKSEYIEDRTRTEYQQLYKGEREKAGNDPLFVKSQWEKNQERQYVPIRTFGLNRKSTARPDGFITARQEINESAVEQEKIPNAYQKIVKTYFQTIKEND